MQIFSDAESLAQSKYWDTDYLSSRFFAGMPARVASSENKGRYVVASADIRAGTKVVEIRQPYAFSVSDEFTSRACAWCFKVSPAPTVVFCENCNQTYYCSESCKIMHKQRHHSFECAPLRALGRQLHLMSYEDSFTSRMIISLLSRRRLEMERPEYVDDPLELAFSDSLLLASNRAQVAPRVMSMREPLWEFLTKVLPSRTSLKYEGDMMSLIGRIDENTFGVRGNINLSYAYGFYPSVSFINHSCSPNLGVIQDKKTLIMYALHDINAGSELNISYLELNRNTETRRRHLMAEYNFFCLCERCCVNARTEADDYFLQDFVCRDPKCDGKGIMIPVPRDSTTLLSRELISSKRRQKYADFYNYHCNLCQKIAIIGHVEDLSDEKPHGLCKPSERDMRDVNPEDTHDSSMYSVLGEDNE